MYIGLFLLLRFVLRREAGALGITDILLIVLLADAAQNGMAGDYHSITDGLILVCTLVGWSMLLNWLSYRYPLWRKLIRPPRVMLVCDGRIMADALDREKISEEELMGEIRNHGVENLRSVKRAYMESDGMISVITMSERSNESPPRDALF